MWNWLKRLFSGRQNCIVCDDCYAKDAMRQIWFKYSDDGDAGTGVVYLCEPCAKIIVDNIEDEILEPDESGYLELEVYDDRTEGL